MQIPTVEELQQAKAMVSWESMMVGLSQIVCASGILKDLFLPGSVIMGIEIGMRIMQNRADAALVEYVKNGIDSENYQ